MKSLSTIIESILNPGFDPGIDYTAEWARYCNARSLANSVRSIKYNNSTGRFDVEFAGDHRSMYIDHADDYGMDPNNPWPAWSKLPWGKVAGVIGYRRVTDPIDIANLPTECGGFCMHGSIFIGSKPHTCKIVDYNPSSNGLYVGYIEIDKARGDKTQFKNTGLLTFDVSGTKRIKNVGDWNCRFEANGQKLEKLLGKKVAVVGL